jgi:hypothetical protein
VPTVHHGTRRVPTGNAKSVTEGGRPAAESTGIKPLAPEGRAAVYELEPGSYAFEADN